MKEDRYHASLLKSNDLPTTPLYKPQNRIAHQTTCDSNRPSSPQDNFIDPNVALAKVTTIPRCRDSITSTTIVTPQKKRASLSIENPHAVASPTMMFATTDESKMTSFFEPISTGNASRLPLEVVPEMNELDVPNSRYSFEPTLPISHHRHAVQPSPVLITFDSSSLKRRT